MEKEEVAALVLRHNYQQTQGISLAEMSAAENLTAHAEWINDLEQEEGVNRALEGLPDEDTIEKRLRSGKGLTRPELCVLISYAKITFTKDLLASDIFLIFRHPCAKNTSGKLKITACTGK